MLYHLYYLLWHWQHSTVVPSLVALYNNSVDKWILWTIRRVYALSAVFVSEFIWRQCCSVWWLWCWYCENPSSRLKRSGWKYSPSLLFTPSLPPTRPRLTQQSGKSGKENFNNASMPFSFTAIRWCFSSFDGRFFTFVVLFILHISDFYLFGWYNWGPPMTG